MSIPVRTLEDRVDLIANMLTEAERTLMSLTFGDADQRRVWEVKVSVLNNLFREAYDLWVRKQVS